MLKKTPRQGKNGNKNGKRPPRVSELPKINNQTDTRDILAHAAKEARQDDYFIVDVDAHVTETAFWSEVVDRMDSDVYKQMARAFKERGGCRRACSMPRPECCIRTCSAAFRISSGSAKRFRAAAPTPR